MPTGDDDAARRLRLGCDAADAALLALARTADPSLWRGPAAAAYAAVLEGRSTEVCRALALARAAATARQAAADAAPGGG